MILQLFQESDQLLSPFHYSSEQKYSNRGEEELFHSPKPDHQ